MKKLEVTQMEKMAGGRKPTTSDKICLTAAGMGVGAAFFPPFGIVAAFGGLACAVATVME
ncbi:hypothetical protein [Flavobacterium sp.]|uniref:hypothetical protein n=1 Tax=Flavobacterium sp. TaxID=239 RepID=UPI0026057561|nr:hypothetical protein [Flavobacterium sp.]